MISYFDGGSTYLSFNVCTLRSFQVKSFEQDKPGEAIEK